MAMGFYIAVGNRLTRACVGAKVLWEISVDARESVLRFRNHITKGKGSPCSITERRVPELIAVLGSQPACDVSHKPGGRLPLLSARPAVTLTTLKRAATNFAAW